MGFSESSLDLKKSQSSLNLIWTKPGLSFGFSRSTLAGLRPVFSPSPLLSLRPVHSQYKSLGTVYKQSSMALTTVNPTPFLWHHQASSNQPRPWAESRRPVVSWWFVAFLLMPECSVQVWSYSIWPTSPAWIGQWQLRVGFWLDLSHLFSALKRDSTVLFYMLVVSDLSSL